MVATSFDSEESLWRKYPSCESHLDELRARGCLLFHDVDLYDDMDRHYDLIWRNFDVIIFNFPHAGHYQVLRETDHEHIQLHKQLHSAFFQSACEMLRLDGEVHVTTRDDYPYNTWNLEELAAQTDLYLREKVRFEKSDYPGYHNKRGDAFNSNKTFPLKDCYTFKFGVGSNYEY